MKTYCYGIIVLFDGSFRFQILNNYVSFLYLEMISNCYGFGVLFDMFVYVWNLLC